MLLDLPRAFLEAVYDELHVADRMRLNAALPRDARIDRTIRTSRAKDDKLALACVAMKKRVKTHGHRTTVSSAMEAFLAANRDDPTVKALVEEHDLTLPCPALVDLKDRIRAGDCAVVAADVPADATDADRDDLLTVLLQEGRPAQLDALAGDDVASVDDRPLRAALAKRDAALFTTLNHRNEHMTAHLAARYGLGSDVATAQGERCVGYVTTGSGRGLLTASHTREVMLRILPLTESQRAAATASALDELDVDAWRRMKAAAAGRAT